MSNESVNYKAAYMVEASTVADLYGFFLDSKYIVPTYSLNGFEVKKGGAAWIPSAGATEMELTRFISPITAASSDGLYTNESGSRPATLELTITNNSGQSMAVTISIPPTSVIPLAVDAYPTNIASLSGVSASLNGTSQSLTVPAESFVTVTLGATLTNPVLGNWKITDLLLPGEWFVIDGQALPVDVFADVEWGFDQI